MRCHCLTPYQTRDKSTDEEFKVHFDCLLNPEKGKQELRIPSVNMYIPLLDYEITPFEVETEIKWLKVNKAAGVDGIPASGVEAATR